MRLGEPDRAAVARREHEPVEHPLLALRHERAAEPEQRREEDRDPEQAARLEPRRRRRQREVEDDERRDDEEEHRRQRVPRPQLEQQVLARERADVADVVHASASRPRRERRDAGGVVGGDEARPVAAQLGELGVEQLGAGLVERRVRLVEHEQRRIVEQDAAEREPLRSSRASTRTRARARTSQSPKRSSSIPIRSRRSGRGRAGRTGRGSRAR